MPTLPETNVEKMLKQLDSGAKAGQDENQQKNNSENSAI